METPFTPTRQDVERYRTLRALGTDLNSRIVKTVPRQAFHDIGEAIGILRNGTLVFDTEDVSSVMMDCCLYEWFEHGKNLVQRYAETHPAKPGTDEEYLLEAYLQAKYRVIVSKSIVPGAGLLCRDVLNGESLFLMDLAMSQGVQGANIGLATRTIPLGEYWMTGGAGLPINSAEAVVDAFMRIERGKQSASADSMALLIVRTCLAAGAGEHIRYETAGATSARPRHEPKHVWRRR
jgi:hypothetical protein